MKYLDGFFELVIDVVQCVDKLVKIFVFVVVDGNYFLVYLLQDEDLVVDVIV